jgi:hypothetical protein
VVSRCDPIPGKGQHLRPQAGARSRAAPTVPPPAFVRPAGINCQPALPAVG